MPDALGTEVGTKEIEKTSYIHKTFRAQYETLFFISKAKSLHCSPVVCVRYAALSQKILLEYWRWETCVAVIEKKAHLDMLLASQVALAVKSPSAKKGDIRNTGSMPRWGRSPGGGHGNSLLHSCLENPMDRGAWRAAVCRVTKSQTRPKWLQMHADMWATFYHNT